MIHTNIDIPKPIEMRDYRRSNDQRSKNRLLVHVYVTVAAKLDLICEEISKLIAGG